MNPIAIIAFNRPDYLARTLASIANQQAVEIGRIALFQDGLVNAHSGKRYGDDGIMGQQIAFFRYLFPQGEVFVAKENLGPAFAMARAEVWAFEQSDADAGFFFEDDMILAPYYLKSLENMLAATAADDRVAYCACYGPLWPAPTAPANSYVPMHMNWAFALRRRNWLRMKPNIDAYLDILRGHDYRSRPMGRIMELRREWGVPGVYTTQDIMRTLACRLTGGIKLNTRASLGRYIGARGLHIDEAAYDAAGFAKVKPFPYELDGFGPVDQKTVAWCCQVHDQFAGIEANAKDDEEERTLVYGNS